MLDLDSHPSSDCCHLSPLAQQRLSQAAAEGGEDEQQCHTPHNRGAPTFSEMEAPRTRASSPSSLHSSSRQRLRRGSCCLWPPGRPGSLLFVLLLCVFLSARPAFAVISDDLIVQTTKGKIRGVTLNSATNK